MNFNLRGTGVALVTPFKYDRGIDFQALERLVDNVIDGGVDYIVALGTTAETPTLSHEERTEVVATVRSQINGRVPLIVGIGGNNTVAVIDAINEMDLTGVSAILSVTPFYNRPNQRGLYEHYKAIAEAVEIPILLYNVPSRTGVNMSSETTLRLATEFKNIIGIKEACGDLEQCERLIAGRPEGFYVISGDDSLALPLIEMGGDGVISVAANAFPQFFSGMIELGFDAQTDKANAKWTEFAPLVKALFDEGNPTGVKAALAARGMIDNVLRLPLVESSDELYSKIAGMINAAEGAFR